MQQKKRNSESLIPPPETRITKFVIASIIIHIAIIASATLDVNFGSKVRDYQKSALNVALLEESPKQSKKVISPSKEIKGKDVKLKSELKLKEKKKKIDIQEKKPLVVGKKKRLPYKKKEIRPDYKEKESKKKVRQKGLDNVISEFKKDIEKNDSQKINDVVKDIEEFKKDIKTEDTKREDAFLAGISKGAKIAEKVDRYRYKIGYEVEKKWALPSELLSSNEFLEAAVVFTVLENGEIVNIWFDKKSGNSYFDESVYRAVQKANPVSPHPEGINKKRIVVGLRFTPKGLK